MSKVELVLALAVAVTVIVVGHVWLRDATAPEPIPTAYEAGRNPHFRRDWMAWTEPPDPLPEARRIVVISNSQGFARELEDATRSFSGVLESELNKAGRNVEVLNWSVGGGNAPEMTVLAARAASHQPSDVVFVTYQRNFVGSVLRSPLSYAISDIPLLIAAASVRRRLSAKFLDHYSASALTAMIGAYTGYGSLRWRTVEEGRQETWDWERGEPEVDLEELQMTTEEWSELSEWAMRDLVGTASRASPEANIWVVSMPLPEVAWSEEGWSRVSRFRARALASLGEGERVRVLDAVDLIPTEHFYTHVHLRADGHAQFGRWLAEHLENGGEAQ